MGVTRWLVRGKRSETWIYFLRTRGEVVDPGGLWQEVDSGQAWDLPSALDSSPGSWSTVNTDGFAKLACVSLNLFLVVSS